jgi:hypothetical protein
MQGKRGPKRPENLFARTTSKNFGHANAALFRKAHRHTVKMGSMDMLEGVPERSNDDGAPPISVNETNLEQ